MITAVIFDLDGTLVQTESLKAQSYAQAAADLRPGVAVQDVVKAYDRCIGRPRNEVAQTLLDHFGLHDAAADRAPSLGVATPLDAFLAIRMRDYETMLGDTSLLKRQEYPYATALLRRVRAGGYATALTTVSHAAQAFIVLDALGLRQRIRCHRHCRRCGARQAGSRVVPGGREPASTGRPPSVWRSRIHCLASRRPSRPGCGASPWPMS